MNGPLTKEFLVEPSDVYVTPIEPEECEDCPAKATHTLNLDIRAAGQEVVLGVYCETCAKTRAEVLKSEL